jgi:hypothetical protein
MIHALLGLALITGLVIAITLFVQHQRDRRAVRRTWEMLHPPPLKPPRSPLLAWSCVGSAAAICFAVFNALASH